MNSYFLLAFSTIDHIQMDSQKQYINQTEAREGEEPEQEKKKR